MDQFRKKLVHRKKKTNFISQNPFFQSLIFFNMFEGTKKEATLKTNLDFWIKCTIFKIYTHRLSVCDVH